MNDSEIGTEQLEDIPYKNQEFLSWICKECNKECIPIRSESRCLCGHRLREHNNDVDHSCKKTNCECKSFFYIVAEGSWILRCRCKHRHTDHHPETYYCKKCNCENFDSPWVCNCNHPWVNHETTKIIKQVIDIQKLNGKDSNDDTNFIDISNIGSDINRWDMLKRGDI